MAEQRLTEGSAEVVIDDHMGSILVTTWFGAPDERLALRYNARCLQLLEDAGARNQRLVFLSDCLDAEAPSPAVRRIFADAHHKHDALLDSVTVVDNPLVRGVVTALRWLLGDHLSLQSVRTLDDAFAYASQCLRDAGIEPPRAAIAAYRRPQPQRLKAHG